MGRVFAATAMIALLQLVSAVQLTASSAQEPQAVVHIDVRHDTRPVADASVVVNGAAYTTDADGAATVPVAAGTVEIVVVKEGFSTASVSLSLEVAQRRDVIVELQQRLEEEITVSATRTDRRLDDQPMRVEVLDREEIEEKVMMTPGDIVMMLNEMGGLRVQATSPSLGAGSVRIQGMKGRYTRFLSDGLPLFGEQVGALGLLQIPPMDLAQVEVIKGVASSLYGAGAMGGVVNLISRKATHTSERELLVNRSARGATDVVVWTGTPLPAGWGLTLLGGGHWQQQNDVDDEGWADLPGYSRAVFRPRLSWDGGNGRTFLITAGGTAEDRNGGTVHDRLLPQAGAPYVEAVDTRRIDVGSVAQMLVGQYVVTGRAAFAAQRHDHQFGETRERDRHDTGFGELTIRGSAAHHTWVAGGAIERDAYRPRELRRFEYTFTVPGVFVQDDVDVATWLSVSASGRLDHHSQYGTFFSPRVSALVRSGHWNSRLSIGAGFFGPSPLTEETEAAGLSRLVIPAPLAAERGRSGSFDIGRTDGPFSYTLTLFNSRISHPIDVAHTDAGLALTNLPSPTSNRGLELLGTLRRPPFSVTGTYTYVQARETIEGVREDVPLTPRHSAGLVGMWERADVGRIGVEWYYTGVQRLEENPYRDRSEPYFLVGLLVERQFGRVRLFVNVEDLNDVRQTKWDPLVRPSRASDGRWTVDGWAPLEGRNVNGGVRLRF